ncbi:hypothetical protein BD311DRAFT_723422, partial [Dichomitus squalens]
HQYRPLLLNFRYRLVKCPCLSCSTIPFRLPLPLSLIGSSFVLLGSGLCLAYWAVYLSPHAHCHRHSSPSIPSVHLGTASLSVSSLLTGSSSPVILSTYPVCTRTLAAPSGFVYLCHIYSVAIITEGRLVVG